MNSTPSEPGSGDVAQASGSQSLPQPLGGQESRPIIIVGGGAGGLELACKLGRALGPERVTLVDAKLFHIWKPSLHEVAAGTLDIHQEGLSYVMLAHDNGFTFEFGALCGLDTQARHLTIDAARDQQGVEILPVRQLQYCELVLAVGSISNHFGVPGAAEHTIALDSPQDAEHFRLSLLQKLTRADLRKEQHTGSGVHVVIIGGGATGVELAAELREASAVLARYGLRRLRPERDIRITLIEASPRILAPLSENVSAAAHRLLAERAVEVATSTAVASIQPILAESGATQYRIDTRPQVTYVADLVVWAAGIRAQPVLARLGLPVRSNGQVEVNSQLGVTGIPHLHALGDCAACPMVPREASGAASEPAKPSWVPPRAQAAHQQASFLYQRLLARAQGRQAPSGHYVYKDHGSLVSLGTQTSVGSLMGRLFRPSWFVEGFLARMMYVSLHLMHHQAVLGTLRTGALAMARFLVKRTRPMVKLH
jgi:NADH dehydrogenase